MGERRPQLSFLEDLLIAGSVSTSAITVFYPASRLRVVLEHARSSASAASAASHRGASLGYMPRAMLAVGWKGAWQQLAKDVPWVTLTVSLKNHLCRMLNYHEDIDGYPRWLAANLAAGASAGSLSHCSLYSFDYARMRLHHDKMGLYGARRQYTGVADVFRKTLASDGISGLYRGFVFSCASQALFSAWFFGLYDSLKPLMGPHQDQLLPCFLLGWAVGGSAGFIARPLQAIRELHMSAEPARPFSGTLRQLFQQKQALSSGTSWLRPRTHPLFGMAGGGFLALFDYASASYIKVRLRMETRII